METTNNTIRERLLAGKAQPQIESAETFNFDYKALLKSATEIQFEDVKTEKVKAPKKVQESKPDAHQLLKQLGELMQPKSADIDEGRIVELILENTISLGEILDLIKLQIKNQEPKVIEVRSAEKSVKIEGQQHKQFEQVLKAISAGSNVWLTGSAGSGKTHTVEQVATALNLTFYCVSVCSQTTESKLLGYNDANGKFSETVFFKAYSEGGVFLLDEIDNGNANVLSVLNSALANGVCAFPCGMVKRHKDFICVAAANTIGTGGNIKYIGRNRIDAATVDRFVLINFEVDTKLEAAICGNADFAKLVQDLRKKAESKGLDCVISPRASINGSKLIAAGFSIGEALDMVIFNKLSANDSKILR